MDRLCRQSNLNAIRTTMTAVPKGVSEYYEDALKRIEDQPDEDKALAKKALTYIFYAKRPLSLAELGQILAVEAGDTDLDPNAVPETEILLTVCAGLITTEEQGATVGLTHFTVQEYLDTHRDKLLGKPDAEFAKACLSYLAFDVFEDGPCMSVDQFQVRLEDYPFLEYASHHWGNHVIGNQLHEGVGVVLSKFLGNQNRLASSVQFLYSFSRRSDNRYDLFPKQHGPLHVAA